MTKLVWRFIETVVSTLADSFQKNGLVPCATVFFTRLSEPDQTDLRIHNLEQQAIFSDEYQMNRDRSLKIIAQSLEGASLVLFLAVLYWAREIFVPLSLGILIAFLLNPVVRGLQRRGLSNTLSMIATVLLVFVTITAFGYAIASSFSGFTEELPKYRAELERKAEKVRTVSKDFLSQFRTKLNLQTATGENVAQKDSESSDRESTNQSPSQTPAQNADRDSVVENETKSDERIADELESWLPDLATLSGGAITVLGPLITAGLVLVFAIFLLLYRDDLRDRFVNLISRGNYVSTADALNEASERIARYLGTQLILNVGYGLVFSTGLYSIGYFLAPDGKFPFIILLGTIAGLVRFVPYVGPWVGAGFPLLLSVIMFPGFSVVLAVAGMIVVMELISNNILEPWFYGNSTGVSPVAIIVSAVFWAWLWGPIGLLLATPLTVCVVVIGTHVPRFRFLAMLLSDKMEVPKAVRGYQRLLTNDQFNINEFVNTESKELDVVGLLDETIIPTIKLVIKDQAKRDLTDEELIAKLREAVIHAGILSIEKDQQASEADTSDEASTTLIAQPDILVAQLWQGCSITANQGEKLVSEIIGQVLSESIQLSTPELINTPEREVERIVQLAPDLVVIHLIPPGGLSHARFWCSELRGAGYRGEIIVAYFGRTRHFDRLLTSFRKRGANSMVTSAKQLCQRIQRFAAKSILQPKSSAVA